MPVSSNKVSGIDSIYNDFRTLREVFLGLSIRHDSLLSRVVICEDEYRDNWSGPVDEWSNKFQSIHSGALREPFFRLVTPEEKENILKNNPRARFKQSEDANCNRIYYIEPSFLVKYIFKGNSKSGNEYHRISEDAGFCLVNLINRIPYQLNLPRLVPYEFFSNTMIRDGGTKRPTDLEKRWNLFVHVLGWQNNNLSPLRAKRFLWDKENCKYMGDPEEIHRQFGDESFKALIEKIPYPPRYFASELLHDVNLASVYAIDLILSGAYKKPEISLLQFKNKLSELKPGQDDSKAYQNLAADILELLFSPSLKYMNKEVSIDGGMGRIDIVFNNCSEDGYFSDLEIHHQMKCPFVFFECKNYSDEIGNDEFAQLLSRLDDKKTKVGFIICRQIKDRLAIQKKCSNHYQNKGLHIMALDDDDLLNLLGFREKGSAEAFNDYLKERFNKIVLNQ